MKRDRFFFWGGGAGGGETETIEVFYSCVMVSGSKKFSFSSGIGKPGHP